VTIPVRKHLVTIQGASAEQQNWVDRFIGAARDGTGDWPHAHSHITLTVVPLATFVHAMEEAGWQLTADGPAERNAQPGTTVSPVPGPNQGTTYHNVLHSLLGDFH